MGHENLQEFVKEEVVGDVLEELDPIRTQQSSVIAGRIASNAQHASFVVIPAGEVFHLTDISVNLATALLARRQTYAYVRLYLRRSAVSSFDIAHIALGASSGGNSFNATNAQFEAHDLKGFVFVASTVTRFTIRASVRFATCEVRLGGFRRDRMAGETTT